MAGIPEGLKAYLRVPFSMIVWVMETYANNRARVKDFMSQSKPADFFKIAIAITVLAWIVIGLSAKEEDGQRLTSRGVP